MNSVEKTYQNSKFAYSDPIESTPISYYFTEDSSFLIPGSVYPEFRIKPEFDINTKSDDMKRLNIRRNSWEDLNPGPRSEAMTILADSVVAGASFLWTEPLVFDTWSGLDLEVSWAPRPREEDLLVGRSVPLRVWEPLDLIPGKRTIMHVWTW